ncbi:MAG: NADPH2:quinone reductase, partial [Candidatus Azotimanducaceae bacterium]
TIGFDATGGGSLASQVLSAMEVAANRSAKEYSRYGSNVFKQVYIYGGLERSQTTLSRTFGMSWSLGGWLLMPFLQKIGADGAAKLRQKVAAEIKTTFVSNYTQDVSLKETLTMDAIKIYGMQATGEKYLVNPNK